MRNDISIIRAAAGVAAFALVALAGCAGKKEKPDSGITPYEPTAEAPQATSAPSEGTGEPVQLQENAPLRYVVQRGDTLWGISQKFLKDSWQWPELWYVNPKVQNPHLIYPGDELYLYYVNGAPRLARAGEGEDTAGTSPIEALPPGGEGALTPHVRESALDQAIYSIPLESIRAFLRGPRMVDDDLLDDAPYLVDFETKKLLGGSDEIAYALEVEDKSITQYQVVRKGEKYRDPDDNDVIGIEVQPVGDAEVRVFGEPATVYLRRSQMEARAGDYLLPLETDPLASRFIPHAPTKTVDGKIISVYNGVSQIGQYMIVALNRGTEHGIELGHVLSVMQSGRDAKDPYSFYGAKVKLPEIKAGTVMVFKTAPRMSYALVMSATRAIHLLDKVEKPTASQ
jgi:LysM repeat protein